MVSIEPLTWGPLMSRVELKKNGHVICHLTIHGPCHFYDVLMSNVQFREYLCRLTSFPVHVNRPHVTCRIKIKAISP